MSNRYIKLVLPAFYYSLLFFSNNLYAMDPPIIDSGEMPKHETEVFIEDEILTSLDAEPLRNFWKSKKYQFTESELAQNLYKHENFPEQLVFIGVFLPGGLEGLLVALVHLTRFNTLKPIIGKILYQFTADKFPNNKRTEIAMKMLNYLDNVCNKKRISDKYQAEVRLSNYDAYETVSTITMKMQNLLLKVNDLDMKDWLENNNCNNSVSNYRKLTDNVRDFFLFEFLQAEDEIQRINFMKNLLKIIKYFEAINNNNGAASALAAFHKIKLYVPAVMENSDKIEGELFLSIIHPTSECLSRLPIFFDLTKTYTIAYESYKDGSVNALLDLGKATSQLKEAKEKCNYSLGVQKDFMNFLDSMDFNENDINALYENIFADNQNFSFSDKKYSEWSTAELVRFFKSHGRIDLLRNLLLLKIMDGTTLHEVLSGTHDEAKSLNILLEPLLQQLLAGQIGSFQKVKIETKENGSIESPTKNKSASKTSRVSSMRTKQLLQPSDSPNSGRKREKGSLIAKMRRSSSSTSSCSRLTFSESSEADVKSESPELDLENLDQVNIKLPMWEKKSQDN